MTAIKKCFINLSNHPSANWGTVQLDAARRFGQIVDIPFPTVEVEATTEEIIGLAEEYSKLIEKYDPNAVMVQGECTLTFHLVRLLKEKGICTLAACARRDTVEEKGIDEVTRKQSYFRFIRFREY